MPDLPDWTAWGRPTVFIRPIRQEYQHIACGGITKIGIVGAELLANDVSVFRGQFCVKCGTYFSIGTDGEFVWLDDGTKVGT